MTDHDYNLKVLREPFDDSNIKDIEVDQNNTKENRGMLDHIPIKSPNPKKLRGLSDKKDDESANTAILHTIQVLARNMDKQTEQLKTLKNVLKQIQWL